jgi:hypothetical protein
MKTYIKYIIATPIGAAITAGVLFLIQYGSVITVGL